MEESSTLRKLQEVQFALVELQFYLDMNPEDMRALHQYNDLSEELIDLRQEYEEQHGPLMQYGLSKARGKWDWSSTPWPWEIEY
ncbi:spore coat protein CotJB [Brevibacillus fluminis]|uniref:Spore coat protein CotJB n=1 Tax=Brevibacillus fluminis TaxID=511487 RepID=A0A3M8DSY6_9BACL|nr:spore coat protein CotJB [Brevibacillus fluminis]RNB91278.1 spore coat protein CotJB [Brevibacillus fluminis]